MRATGEVRRGILYVATGHDRYLDEAVAAAERARAEMPQVRIGLATDRADVPEVFDTALQISGDAVDGRISAIAGSPFDETLYLDTDTRVLDDLAPLFELLGRFDLAAAHAAPRIGAPVPGVPEAFPEYDTGVIAWRRAPGTRRFLRDWAETYASLQGSLGPAAYRPAFRAALYRSDLRIATLTAEWNLRLRGNLGISIAPRVLHGRPAGTSHEEIARILREGTSAHPGVVVIGGRAFGGRKGRLIGELERGRRRRPLRRSNPRPAR